MSSEQMKKSQNGRLNKKNPDVKASGFQLVEKGLPKGRLFCENMVK